MKKTKRKSLQEAEQRLDALLKRVGYTGKYGGKPVHDIPDYKVNVSVPTSDRIPAMGPKKLTPKYSGNEIMGISDTHKSNAIPIRRDNKQAAIDAAQMRRN